MKLRLLDIIPYQENYLLLIEKLPFQMQINASNKFDVEINGESKMQISNLREFDEFPVISAQGFLLFSDSDLKQLVQLKPRKKQTFLKLVEKVFPINKIGRQNNSIKTSRPKKSPSHSFFIEEIPPKKK